jgi:transposase-like protein
LATGRNLREGKRQLKVYRAVDKAGATVDFLLTAKQDRKAALRFLRKAMNGNGAPEKITIDKSSANIAAIRSAAATLASIELMHMIRKGQLLPTGDVRPARQFYSLAG